MRSDIAHKNLFMIRGVDSSDVLSSDIPALAGSYQTRAIISRHPPERRISLTIWASLIRQLMFTP